MHAIQRLYPRSYVKYAFTNRGKTAFPEGFAAKMKEEVDAMAELKLSNQEKRFIERKCYFFDPVFIDFLEGYRYDPSEVKIEQNGGDLSVTIEGYWYRTVLWEVPLLAIISELYYQMAGSVPAEVEEKAKEKAKALKDIEADYSEFGTRRRFSFDVQDKVIGALKANSGEYFKGTSNVYFAMKYNTTPIGTMPHEWFMFHGAVFGYRSANIRGLEAWVDVYDGSLGIALTDTYTTDAFFNSFSLQPATLFDGVRQDSGDPLEFSDKALKFYERNRIDPTSKTLVFSDSLNLESVKRIKDHVGGKMHDTYGIGTFFSNDVGAKPLNIVIKLTDVKPDKKDKIYLKAVKLSDAEGKHTGDEKEIDLSLRTLGLE